MFRCAAPYANKPEYVLAQQYANDIADLLAPQSGAYYDVWLDGEKFVSVYKEVGHTRTFLGGRSCVGLCVLAKGCWWWWGGGSCMGPCVLGMGC